REREIGREEGISFGREEGISLGREEGRVEGILQEKKDSAKRMLEEKIDISMISKITGLTEEEISKL
ncbi:MAG: hypothetical protein IKE70_03675, partial [Bacilli bacterium]|nr:hypothetical protein [Bacilli bacterium]